MSPISPRTIASLAAVTLVWSCDDRSGQPQYAVDAPPPSTRSCSDGELQLVQSAMAQKTYDEDKCIWLSKSASASLSSCEVEQATRLIKADGTVTIHDGFTSDTFDQSVTGIFSPIGEVLQLSRTATSYSYDEACKRAGVVAVAVIVAGLANSESSESDSSR